jgi:hypothetical protein
VLDEVSMVGDGDGRDLLAFGKPILVLGDPGQLPPVKGTGFFTEAAPDVMLTEVHRQAEDSPILRLATLARQGRRSLRRHDDQVWKMSRHEVSPAQMLQGGQVICGTNATRRRLNTAMKGAAGFEADYPTGGGEKIICLRNRHDLGLINGMYLTSQRRARIPETTGPFARPCAPKTAPASRALRTSGAGNMTTTFVSTPIATARNGPCAGAWSKAAGATQSPATRPRAASTRRSSSSTTASATAPKCATAGSTPRSPGPSAAF